MLKGHAHLNKGQVDQALQVKTSLTYLMYLYLIKLAQCKLLSLLQVSSELMCSSPNLAQGFILRGLIQIAQGHQQLAEER